MDSPLEYRGLEDPADTLTDIDRLYPFVSGLVVVASVDLELQVMLAAAPLPGEPSCGWDLLEVGCVLSDVAFSLLPARPRGRAEGPVAHSLITVVCRRGDASQSAGDERWAEAWLCTDRSIDAVVGEIFTVTPSGWRAVGGRRSGAEPRLRPRLSLVRSEPARLGGSRSA